MPGGSAAPGDRCRSAFKAKTGSSLSRDKYRAVADLRCKIFDGCRWQDPPWQFASTGAHNMIDQLGWPALAGGLAIAGSNLLADFRCSRYGFEGHAA